MTNRKERAVRRDINGWLWHDNGYAIILCDHCLSELHLKFLCPWQTVKNPFRARELSGRALWANNEFMREVPQAKILIHPGGYRNKEEAAEDALSRIKVWSRIAPLQALQDTVSHPRAFTERKWPAWSLCGFQLQYEDQSPVMLKDGRPAYVLFNGSGRPLKPYLTKILNNVTANTDLKTLVSDVRIRVPPSDWWAAEYPAPWYYPYYAEGRRLLKRDGSPIVQHWSEGNPEYIPVCAYYDGRGARMTGLVIT